VLTLLHERNRNGAREVTDYGRRFEQPLSEAINQTHRSPALAKFNQSKSDVSIPRLTEVQFLTEKTCVQLRFNARLES
jgi:hypothetical protein